MSKKVIVGLGEILWDLLPSGKALGGAPANFAYHAQRLGEEGWAVSAVGDDALGREILDIVDGKGLHHLISVAGLFGLDGDDTAACRALIARYGLRLVILTRGPQGSEVITPEAVIPQAAGEAVVVDTVGAGDSFTAAFVVAYLRGDSLADAQRLASDTAAYVCSRKGAMPV